MLKRLTGWGWPLFAGAVAFVAGLLRSQAPVPHEDTVRDFLLARDCWELGTCHTAGPVTSMGGIWQGGTWIHVLAVFHMLGGSAQTVQLCIMVVQAVAVAILAAVMARSFGSIASYAATVAYAYALSQIGDTRILWNPGLLAPFVTLAFTGCFLAARTGRSRPLILASVMVGFGISIHPVCTVLFPAVLLLASVTAHRPILVVSECLLACVIPIVITSWEAVRLNALNFNSVSGWFVVTGVIAGSVLGGSVARNAWSKCESPRRDVATASLLIAPVLIGMLVRVGLGSAFNWYYMHPALPALCAAIGILSVQFIRHVRAHRWILSALAVLATSHGELTSRAWRLDDGKPLASHIFQRPGTSWDALVPGIQGSNCYAMTSLLSVHAPFPRDAAPRQPQTIQVLNLQGTAIEEARSRGFDILPIPGGGTAGTRFFESAVDARHGNVCLDTDRGERTCQTLIRNASEYVESWAFRFVTRAYPEAHSIVHVQPYTVEFRFALNARTSAITVSIVEDEGCSWQIVEVEGASFTGALPASSVTLLPGPAAGHIAFQKRYDARTCPHQQIDRRFPPCVLETLPGEEGLVAIARRLPR